MDIKEKAQEYAKDKIQQVLNDAIAEAYIEGYKQGYEDGKAEVPIKHENDEKAFVDLGLPSGTLWAKDYLKENGEVVYLPYDEAKNYKLPTIEQFRELKKWIEIHSHKNEADKLVSRSIIGPNGNSLYLEIKNFYKGETLSYKSDIIFWLEDDNPIKKDRPISNFISDYKIYDYTFMGYKLPVLLVK